jgi:diacylglycerol kinase (ATP)
VDPLLVITNSDAGTSDEERLAAALAVLRQRVVVAGGDGSLHAVVAALYRRHDLKNAVLGLLPLGTGNDFARGNDIPLDIEDAARVLLRDRPQPMDLVVDEVGEVVVNSVHVGAGANASRRGQRWKDRLHSVGVGKANLGKLGYPIGALLTAWDPPIIRVRVEVDGVVVNDLHQPVLMAAVGNGPSVGGGAELTPDADPGDGQLDVMVSRSVGPLARLLYAARLGFASHHERDDVTYLRGTSVSISGGPFWCSADGEIYGPERHRMWHVETEAYRMLLP